MKQRFDDMNYGILDLLEAIPDPRCKRGVRYQYSHLLLMAIYAVLAGYSEAVDMEYYVELNYDYFKNLIGLKEVPSHDTFSRVLHMTDMDKLGENISKWIMDNFPDILERTQGLKVLHVDGKASRAASEKSKGKKSIYNLNAMYEGESISVNLQKIGDKENEVSLLPDFLDQFKLADTIVTIDAIGCTQNVLNTIVDKKGYYMVPVKDNQPNLKNAILEEIAKLEKEGKFDKLDKTERTIKEHGRYEKITMHLIKNNSFIFEKLGLESFYGSIARIGVIDKKTVQLENGVEKVSHQRSLVITNFEKMSVENMLKIKLSHWNVEAQHWLLDVQLNEDKMTARKGNAVQIGAILRRFCLLMRKYDPAFESKPLKRFLMANEHDIKRIEEILFVKSQEKSEG